MTVIKTIDFTSFSECCIREARSLEFDSKRKVVQISAPEKHLWLQNELLIEALIDCFKVLLQRQRDIDLYVLSETIPLI